MNRFTRNMLLTREAADRVAELEFTFNKNWGFRDGHYTREKLVRLIDEIRDARMTRNALRHYEMTTCQYQ